MQTFGRISHADPIVVGPSMTTFGWITVSGPTVASTSM